MICPTCRFCADHGLDHICLTRGGSIGRLRDHIVMAHPTYDALDGLMVALVTHPARPLGDWTADLIPELPIVRRLDPTWCNCQCEDRPTAPQPAPTPRTREDQHA